MPEQLTPIQEFEKNWKQDSLQERLQNAIPKSMDLKKFNSCLFLYLRTNEDLLYKDRNSLMSSIFAAASDGLLIDAKESALVKFKEYVKYMPMFQGILKKIRNSGELGSIDAIVVYQDDEYESWIDENGPHFKHKRNFEKMEKPILTYAYAKTKDGFIYFEEIIERDMAKIKASARTKYIWEGPFADEMRRKSAIRRIAKRLPMSTDVDSLFKSDDEFYDLDGSDKKEEPKNGEEKKSTLEKAMEQTTESNTSSGSETQEIKQEGTKEENPEEQKQEDQPEIKKEMWYTEGVIDDMKVKVGPNGENGKPKWIKHGFRIDGKYYTTFSKSLSEKAKDLMDKKYLVKVKFEETIKENKKFYTVHELELIPEENSNLPI